MIFSNLFFILFFLPLCLLIYYKMPDIERKNRVLLIFSLVFYAWGGVRYLLLLFAMTAVGWFFALQIQKYDKNHKLRKRWLVSSIAILLAVLGIFKYTGFFLGTFGALFRQDWKFLQFALPLGISFYTFKLISYIADVYNEKTEAEKSYWIMLLYTGLFHHCMAGPIVRYTSIKNELTDRKISIEAIAAGIYRFCIGLAKKSILANHCGVLADSLLPLSSDLTTIPAAGIWLGALFYMLQIYLDFSAYSDMAIGLGWMIGFHYEENFNYPYIASSVKDFWKRWHISLSTFFRDYVYIPLGGSRCSLRRTTLNLLAVWALTGLWHGASWNYVLWGLYYFAFIVFENWRRKKEFKPWHPVLNHVYTLAVVYVGWIFFRFENFSNLGTAFLGMFGLNQNGFSNTSVAITLENNIFFLIFAILAVTPLFGRLRSYAENYLKSRGQSQVPVHAGKLVIAVLLLLLSILALVGNSYSPFLYYQF